ncbi:MAG: hypothetical protein ACE5I1_15805 [bacterium]
MRKFLKPWLFIGLRNRDLHSIGCLAALARADKNNDLRLAQPGFDFVQHSAFEEWCNPKVCIFSPGILEMKQIDRIHGTWQIVNDVWEGDLGV